MLDFIPGLKLSQMFFERVVKPLVDQEFPDLKFAAALSGNGSGLLGYDDRLSTDHDWGLCRAGRAAFQNKSRPPIIIANGKSYLDEP